MNLDIITLMAAGAFIAAISGTFLFGAWTQMRSEPALAWWAASQFVLAMGVAFLVAGLSSGFVPLVMVGAIAASTSPAVAWAGTRAFHRRRVYLTLLFMPVVANVLAGAIPAAGLGHTPSVVTGFVVALVYLLGSAWELWRGRGEVLPARLPLAGLFLMHGSIYAAGIYDALAGKIDLPARLPPLNSGFGLIHFESLAYSLGAAVCMVLLAKERSESRYMRAAQMDALTGLINRGAVVTRAERLLARCQMQRLPFSVIVFDLDHFKCVNDSMGHAVGDRVLRTFADTISTMLRPNDLAGRYGGEEFVVVLPGADGDTAFVVADRVRNAFGVAGETVDGFALAATVSGGVAAAWSGASLRDVIDAADEAMYRAKGRGRNRIERAVDPGHAKDAKVLRVVA